MSTIFERSNRLREEEYSVPVSGVNLEAKTSILPTIIPNAFETSWGTKRYDWKVAGSRTGQSVPGWRSKLKRNQNAVSPYAFDRYVVISSSPAKAVFGHSYGYYSGGQWIKQFEAEYTLTGFFHDVTNDGLALFGHQTSITAEMQAYALNKCYDKLRQDAYSINGLHFLGEARELIHMLRNPLEAARKATTQYLNTLKAKRKEVKSTVLQRKSETPEALRQRRLNATKNGMSGSWLELQFGMLPAISDAKDILDASYKMLNDLSFLKRSRIRTFSNSAPYVDVMNYRGYQLSTESLRNDWFAKKSSTSGIQYVFGTSHKVSGPVQTIEGALQQFGFQIQNFVPTIYELIPWSFLIDYFVNLGDIIEAACTDTSSVTWISKTERHITDIEISDVYSSYSSTSWHAEKLAGKLVSNRHIRHVTISRTNPSSLPYPPLVVSIPGLDSKKWINMAALLTSSRNFRF